MLLCSFLAALGLHGCLRAFLRLREQGLLFTVVCGLFSAGAAPGRALGCPGGWGSAALRRPGGSSRPREGSRAPCLGRRSTLDHQGSLRKVIPSELFIAEGHPETSSDPRFPPPFHSELEEKRRRKGRGTGKSGAAASGRLHGALLGQLPRRL